jgi:hypothetical protein
VLVAALFGHDGIPEDVGDLAFDGTAFEVHEADTVGGEDGHVSIVEEEDVACVAEDGWDVGGDEVLGLAEADDDGGAVAGDDDLARIEAGDGGDGEDALELVDALADGVFEVPLEVAFDEVRDDFGIGLGMKDVAGGFEVVLELKIVFDDAVVDNDDVAVGVAVGVGVFLSGTAVSRPAGMADAVGAVDGREVNGFFEIVKLAGGAADVELILGVDEGDPC